MRYACLAAIVCFLPLAACGFEAPAPARTPPPAAPKPPLSTISATLTLPLADLLRIINVHTEGRIADIRNQRVACMIATCSLDLLAVRTDAITGTAEGESLSFTVPLAVNAHMAVNGGFFRTSAQGQVQGVAHATTNLRLAPDWRLEPQTRGSIRLSEGQLKLGPVKMNIAELWNHNAAHLSDMLFRTLDHEIAGHVRIRPSLDRLWAQLAKPIRIGKRPEAWLLLAPQRIFLAQPVTRDNALVLSLGLAVRAQAVIGNLPPRTATVGPLPAPSPLSAPANRFTLSLPVLLPYAAAAQFVMQRLASHPLHVAGMPVKITNLTILPSGRDVVVAAHFCVRQTWDILGWFDSCGTGYLRGAPQYDNQAQTIRIANLRYDMTTANVLLAAAKSLAGDALGKALQSRLVFPVGKDIAKLNEDVTQALAEPHGGDLRISGRVESFGQPSLTWTSEGFLALFTAQGQVVAQLRVGSS